MTIKRTTILNMVQGFFMGGMLAICNIYVNDWRFFVIIIGNAVITGLAELAAAKEK